MLQGIYDTIIKIENTDCMWDLFKDKMWHNNAFGKACLNLSHCEQFGYT